MSVFHYTYQSNPKVAWLSDYAENVATMVVGMIPEIGAPLSMIVGILWPGPAFDTWAEIEQQVETLVDRKLDALVWSNVQNDLAGLQNVLNDYIVTVHSGDLKKTDTAWSSAKALFLYSLPAFQDKASLPNSQDKDNKFLLLPSFVQFGNMYLALLRDGVLFGASWGWEDAYQQQIAEELTDTIEAYSAYFSSVYDKEYQRVVSTVPITTKDSALTAFAVTNQFVRQMTFLCLDFTVQWPYFDASKYPSGTQFYISREIYSDPIGTTTDSGAIVLPSPPTEPISQLTVWGYDRIDAVQVGYPAGGGPGGATIMPRQGNKDGGTLDAPYGGVFEVAPDNPVTEVFLQAVSVIGCLKFTFSDGSTTGMLAKSYPKDGAMLDFTVSYYNEILSSIHINGISNFFKSADCIVFGFKFPQTTTISLELSRTAYIASPKGLRLTELASKFPFKTVDTDALIARAKAEDWDAMRQTYWNRLMSNA